MQQGQSTNRWLERTFPRVFASLATGTYRLVCDRRGWLPLALRIAGHAALVSAALAALGMSALSWPAQKVAHSLSPETGNNDDDQEASAVGLPRRETMAIGGMPQDTVIRIAQPHTSIPDRPRLGVITYTVQAGDTVQAIADSFRILPTTISWANPAVEDAPDLLRIGQELVMLPVDGVYHEVAEGDTLGSIAEKYEVESQVIADCGYNGLKPPRYSIEVGMWLIVPGGQRPYVPRVVTSYTGPIPEGAVGTGRLQWPVLGRITQGYWYGHRAIDVGAPIGSAVHAVDTGYVSFAGWTDVGYGYLIVVDHGNSLSTYYAHLSNIYVAVGQSVDTGQVIGAVGSTGWSTGPHLHFEVRRLGLQQNPRAYLP